MILINIFLPSDYKIKVVKSYYTSGVFITFICYLIENNEEYQLGSFRNIFSAFYRCWRHYIFFKAYYRK